MFLKGIKSFNFNTDPGDGMDMKFIDKKFRIFLEIAESGSFSAAARKLSLSQSVISFHVDDFEKELGVSLFKRQGRFIDLTPEGRLLYEKGRKLASDARNLQDLLLEHSDYLNRSLYLGGDALTCSYALPWTLASFCKINPDIIFSYRHLDEETLIEALLNSELDLALVSYALRHKKINTQECLKDDVVLVSAASPVGRRKISRDKLKELPLLWVSSDRGLELAVNHGLSTIELVPKDLNISVEITDLVFLKNLIRAGMGLAFLPMQTVADELNCGQMEILDVDGLEMSLTTHILTKKNQKLRAVVNEFLEFAGSSDTHKMLSERLTTCRDRRTI